MSQAAKLHIGHLGISEGFGQSAASGAETPINVVLLGAPVRRLFVIWNRAYKQAHVIAKDFDEAIQISLDSRHVKRLSNHRRCLDITDQSIAEDQSHLIGCVTLAELLDGEKSGMAHKDAKGCWSIED